MILYLDTSTSTCRIWLDDTYFEHETNRDLARDLLGLVLESISLVQGKDAGGANLQRSFSRDFPPARTTTYIPDGTEGFARSAVPSDAQSMTSSAETGSREKDALRFATITGVAVMQGPGSFTGLRIGLTVANALADQLHIPIIAETGENWRAVAKARFAKGENDKLALPLYGKPANITTPKK